MVSVEEKAAVFRALHEARDAFYIPNSWDGGSARVLEAQGFKALATTSAGFAKSLGRKDGEVTLDEKLDHCRLLASVTTLPITVDFENGFADAPGDVAANILALAETGVVGGSVEDWSREAIYDFDLAVERVAAAAEAARRASIDFMLTARAEGVLRQTHDLDEIIRRLVAFEAAGADVLYAPGLKTLDEVKLVMEAVTRPVNVLLPFFPGTPQADFAALGVARLSLGGALQGRTTKALEEMAREILEGGQA